MSPRFAAAICLLASATSGASAGAATLRVLFLGNSLTDGNDVPGIVQALAALHDVTLVADSSAPGGFALEDHWNTGHATMVRDGRYDLVVLQQGPSTLPESQANLRQWTQTWTTYAHSQATEAALFMVWPFVNQTDGFELVSLSYRNAATAAGIEVFPAGEAWSEALASRPRPALYSDDLHATPEGSLLAAMVIGRRLFALDPARVPTLLSTRSGPLRVSTETLNLFRSIVAAMTPTQFDPTLRPAPPPAANTAALPAPTGNIPGGSSGTNRGGGGSPAVAATLALALLLLSRHHLARR